MSDYISKSDVIKIIEKEIENSSDFLQHDTQIDIMFEVQELPTVDEKEIIRKPFERVLERLEEKKQEYLEGFRVHQDNELYGIACGFGDSIKICKEEGGIE